MRLLLIEEDPRESERLQHHLTKRLSAAEVAIHSPRLHGTLPPEFLAQGFDAVLLSRRSAGSRGLDWVKDLGSRSGFAPIVYLGDQGDEAGARRAHELGAHTVVGRDELDGEPFAAALTAVERERVRSRAAWRASEAGQASQRFGSAFIPGYRRIRQIAAGAVSD